MGRRILWRAGQLCFSFHSSVSVVPQLFVAPVPRLCPSAPLSATGRYLGVAAWCSEIWRIPWNILHCVAEKNRQAQRHRPDNLLKISKSQMLGNISTFFIWLFIRTLPVDWDSRCLKDKVHDCTGGLGLVTLSVEKNIVFFEHRTLNLNDLGMDQYLLIPFLMGWTSINPSYFGVH